jgi:hypothetical protein
VCAARDEHGRWQARRSCGSGSVRSHRLLAPIGSMACVSTGQTHSSYHSTRSSRESRLRLLLLGASLRADSVQAAMSQSSKNVQEYLQGARRQHASSSVAGAHASSIAHSTVAGGALTAGGVHRRAGESLMRHLLRAHGAAGEGTLTHAAHTHPNTRHRRRAACGGH